MVDAQIGAKGSVLIMVSFALTLAASPAQASLTLFLGADDGAGSLASAPNSTAAAASFDAAVAGLGIEHTITFENSPLGTFSSLDLGSGITLTGSNVNNNSQSIVNTTTDARSSSILHGTRLWIQHHAGRITISAAVRWYRYIFL